MGREADEVHRQSSLAMINFATPALAMLDLQGVHVAASSACSRNALPDAKRDHRLRRYGAPGRAIRFGMLTVVRPQRTCALPRRRMGMDRFGSGVSRSANPNRAVCSR